MYKEGRLSELQKQWEEHQADPNLNPRSLSAGQTHKCMLLLLLPMGLISLLDLDKPAVYGLLVGLAFVFGIAFRGTAPFMNVLIVTLAYLALQTLIVIGLRYV